MAALYCTQDDVKARLALYVPDIDSLIVTPAAMSAALESASATVRSAAAVAYGDSSAIDALSPYPADVVDLAAILACQDLIRRVGSLSQVASAGMVEAYRAEVTRLWNTLRLGALVGNDGVPVPTGGSGRLVPANASVQTFLTEVYQYGPRSYFG